MAEMADTVTATPSAVYKNVRVTDLLDTVEIPFYYLGLDTASKRFFAGVFVSGGLLFWMKPNALFTDDGRARPWKLTSQSPDACMIPWWIYPVAFGGVLATFI